MRVKKDKDGLAALQLIAGGEISHYLGDAKT